MLNSHLDSPIPFHNSVIDSSSTLVWVRYILYYIYFEPPKIPVHEFYIYKKKKIDSSMRRSSRHDERDILWSIYVRIQHNTNIYNKVQYLAYFNKVLGQREYCVVVIYEL